MTASDFSHNLKVKKHTHVLNMYMFFEKRPNKNFLLLPLITSGLERIPNSVWLWKETVDLESSGKRRAHPLSRCRGHHLLC